jgi:hypothetical protein
MTEPIIQPLWMTVTMATLAAITPIFGYFLHRNQKETKALVLKIELSINSRMDKLLEITESSAFARGAHEEKNRIVVVETKAHDEEEEQSG